METGSSVDDSLTVQVVGAGTVGEALGKALVEWGQDVVFKDVDESVCDTLAADGYRTARLETPVDADLSLVAVPTPLDRDGTGFATEALEDALKRLATQQAGVVSIHSTLIPGTLGRIAQANGIEHYAVVPEFLFADRACRDALTTEDLLVGANTDLAFRTIERAFAPGRTNIRRTSPPEAALVKLASNAFAATRISFANQIWRLANRIETVRGLDVDAADALAHFRRLSPWVGTEDGLEGGRPYGGHCLPKDTRALSSWADTVVAAEMHQLEGTIRENETMQRYEGARSEPEINGE